MGSKLDGCIGYQLTVKLPGSKAYMDAQRTAANSIIYNKGSATFFVTFTANSTWKDLAKYLEKIWLFRDAPRPVSGHLTDYDVAFTCSFVIQKFRAVRSIFTRKGFWSAGEFDIIIEKTEF